MLGHKIQELAVVQNQIQDLQTQASDLQRSAKETTHQVKLSLSHVLEAFQNANNIARRQIQLLIKI